jgi:lipopolysaccharide heptosyltransferase II
MSAVQSVVVLRALMLGDMLCATPALRALRAGMPQAHISLIGLAWARQWVQRLASVDEFIEFPGWPGLPERTSATLRTQLQFLSTLRKRQFDWALQLHGSGGIVNPMVAGFDARQTAGFADAQAWVPSEAAGHFIEWPTQGTEVERLLRLTDHLGMPRQGLQLDFPLRGADRKAASHLCRSLQGRPFAVVHPGSQLPSRRWPAQRFAEVADLLTKHGLAVVLTGSASEIELTQHVAAAMQTPSLNLAGLTTLWSLGALVEQATVVLCNDTGISHVAAALGTPSVVVSSGGDASRWAPQNAARHRVFSHHVPCRPCAYAHCPIEHPCAMAVEVEAVSQAALAWIPQHMPRTSHG